MSDRERKGCSASTAERNVETGRLSEECKRCLRERPTDELREKCKGWDVMAAGCLREFEYGDDA